MLHRKLKIEQQKQFGHFLIHDITGFVTSVTRRDPLVEQELLTLSMHLRSPLIFSVVFVAQSLAFGVAFCRFVLFLLDFILPFPLRSTPSDYSFGINKNHTKNQG
jgi:hypothetical protein